MRVIAIQFKGYRQDIESSQNHLYDLIEIALQNHADLIVTPELSCSQYLFDHADRAFPFAMDLESPFMIKLCTLMKTYQSTLVFGVIERDRSTHTTPPVLYNSAAIINATGECFFYRKRLLFDADKTWSHAGQIQYKLPSNQSQVFHQQISYTNYPIFDVNGYRCSVGICMDLNDDEFTQFCAQAQLDLIAFPTNWLNEDHEVYHYWAHRLQDSSAILVAANTYGNEDWPNYPAAVSHVKFRGESAIIDLKQRKLLALAPLEDNTIIFADLPDKKT